MNPNSATVAVGVVILAAGASSRMGKPKMLLPWGATSVLGHQLEQWRHLAVGQLAVVCAAGDITVSGELDRLGVSAGQRIVNPAPDQGMFGSIQRAAQWAGWKSELTHWIVALGDQPHLRLETLRALMAFGAAHPQKICQPAHHGRPRHPVWMPKAVFAELASASEDQLRQFLQHRATKLEFCAVADPGLDLDMDTPTDYERARRFF